jgi:hypothetical protein
MTMQCDGMCTAPHGDEWHAARRVRRGATKSEREEEHIASTQPHEKRQGHSHTVHGVACVGDRRDTHRLECVQGATSEQSLGRIALSGVAQGVPCTLALLWMQRHARARTSITWRHTQRGTCSRAHIHAHPSLTACPLPHTPIPIPCPSHAPPSIKYTLTHFRSHRRVAHTHIPRHESWRRTARHD